jgi:hypothetical protein
MTLLEYVKGLAPIVERRDLMAQLEGIRTAYDETLAPLLLDVKEGFAGHTFKSKLMRDYDVVLRRFVKVQGSSFDVMVASLENMRTNLDVVEREARALFSVQFTNTSLTFNRATVLKYVDAMNFYVRYGRKFLLYLVGAEAAQLGKAAPMKWSTGEVDWVHTNMQQFVNLFVAMSLTDKELKQRIHGTSSAELNDETFDLALSSLGAAKADPLQLEGFSPQSNPLMLMGKFLAEWRFASYQTAKEEYYCLQLRLQELRELQAGNPSSLVIQDRIVKFERRASDYEYKLLQVEEKAAGAEAA